MTIMVFEQVNEARRRWREMKAIEAAQQRATSAQVRAELARVADAVYEAIDPQYRDGRHEVASNAPIALRLGQNGEPDLFIAGVADALLDRIGCAP